MNGDVGKTLCVGAGRPSSGRPLAYPAKSSNAELATSPTRTKNSFRSGFELQAEIWAIGNEKLEVESGSSPVVASHSGWCRFGIKLRGVVNSDAFGGSEQQTIIRGLESFFNRRWNGFNDRLFRPTFDLADVDRVEIVKGPASVLYGNNLPGGIINIVTKKIC